MRVGFLVLSAALLTLLPRPAHACKCDSSYSACNEVGASNLVFTGRVESIEPVFLNRWSLPSSASLRALNEAYNDAKKQPSAASLTRLKDTYLNTFPELAADEKSHLRAARTATEVTSIFYSGISRGMRIHFKVETLFKNHDDDDDAPKAAGSKDAKAKNDDAGKDGDEKEKKSPESIEIWTPFGDCGYDFQAGETYLVYATNDNEGGGDSFSTGSCTRTRRLSDAGDDLAYLFFYKEHPKQSARLEGFTTTDVSYRLNFDQMHDPAAVKSPVAGVVVEVQSSHMTRFAETDRDGRFVFDGLGEGDYKASGFAHGYPVNAKLLAGPQQFHIGQKSCALQILLLPKDDGIEEKGKR